MEETIARLVSAVAELDEDTMNKALADCIAGGFALETMESALQDGLKQVGERFAQGQYYLADMIVGGDLYQEAMNRLLIQKPEKEAQGGKVLIGVMKDDIHDIGKDIVRMLLTINGYQVEDLGVDVPDETFLEAAERMHPDIIALCGVMTFSVNHMIRTIDLLNALPNRKEFRIIVGGSCIDEKTARRIGADGFTKDAYNVPSLCRDLTKERG